ncbi:hypothetical protein BamMEX5DRAFT_3250 [Burkholderia ambifaria MEX-5]|uniref:Uncharacterized protein n=1 Tax=Burkholderia ambifaria MEX-5 TaxID=396597 RepID=B1T634_9BURK|nr:hypothetical protein BamMEX5DRAFT_3250 [Burkholderia ambifaria MEX-5]
MQCMQQAAAVVMSDVHARGQVALGDTLRGVERDLELAAEVRAHAFQHQHHHGGRDRAEHGRHREPAADAREHRRTHVVHVHAGHEIPVPRREALHSAGLVLRLVGARLRPQILDEALAAFRVAGLHDLDEQVLAVRVREIRHVLAVEFGLDRMHHDHRLRVVDRDVAVGAVAHRGDRLERLLLRVGFRQRILLRQLVVMVGDARGLCDERRQLVAAVRDHRRACLPRADAGDHEQAEPQNDDHRGEFLVQGEGAHG